MKHHTSRLIAVGLGVSFLAAQALAQSAAPPVSISINVPPMQEMLQAQSAGAQGAWTVDGRGNGMMVRLVSEAPDPSGERGLIAVYSGPNSRYEVRLVSQGGATRLNGQLVDSQGVLSEQLYAMPARAAAPDDAVELLISTL